MDPALGPGPDQHQLAVDTQAGGICQPAGQVQALGPGDPAGVIAGGPVTGRVGGVAVEAVQEDPDPGAPPGGGNHPFQAGVGVRLGPGPGPTPEGRLVKGLDQHLPPGTGPGQKVKEAGIGVEAVFGRPDKLKSEGAGQIQGCREGGDIAASPARPRAEIGRGRIGLGAPAADIGPGGVQVGSKELL